MEEGELLKKIGLKKNPFVIELGGEWETVWSGDCWNRFVNSVKTHKTVALTGNIGIGKTTFIREVVKRFNSGDEVVRKELEIDQEMVKYLLYFPMIPDAKELKYDLAETIEFPKKASFLKRLLDPNIEENLRRKEIEYLIEKTGNDLKLIQMTNRIVLLFDEAQDSVKEKPETMQFLRMFSDEAGSRRIVFVGLPKLTEQIVEGSLRSRIVEREFPTLSIEEIKEVIRKRLSESHEHKDLDEIGFTQEAIDLLCSSSKNVRDVLQKGNRFFNYLCKENLASFSIRDVKNFIIYDNETKTDHRRTTNYVEKNEESDKGLDKVLESRGYDFNLVKDVINNLSKTEMKVLSVVAENPNNTQIQLLEFFKTSRQALARHLNKLQEQKIIDILEDKIDKRKKVYRLNRKFELKITAK